MFIDKLVDSLARVYRHVGAGLAIALVAVVLGNIILREGFGVPVVWANELALVLFVWMVFIGAGVAFAEGSRIRFTLIIDSLPTKTKVWNELLVSYAGLLVFVGFLTMSLYMAWTFRNQRFTSMDATVAWEWMSAPVGSLLATLGWIRHGLWHPGHGLPERGAEPSL